MSHDNFLKSSPRTLDKLFNLNTNYEKNIILETMILLNGNNKQEDIYLDDLSIFFWIL